MTTLFDPPQPQNLLRFACPHCAAVLAVPMEQCRVAGPCPKCWRSILPPALDEFRQPISSAPVKSAPVPFQSKLLIPSIVLTEDKARDREVRARVQHSRRMKFINKMCDDILHSRKLQIGKIILCIALVGFLAFTYRYMKKNRWTPWWKTPEPITAPAVIPATPAP